MCVGIEKREDSVERRIKLAGLKPNIRAGRHDIHLAASINPDRRAARCNRQRGTARQREGQRMSASILLDHCAVLNIVLKQVSGSVIFENRAILCDMLGHMQRTVIFKDRPILERGMRLIRGHARVRNLISIRYS